jgi:hypothetical protein
MDSFFYRKSTKQKAAKIPLCAIIKVRSATAYLLVRWKGEDQLKGLKG